MTTNGLYKKGLLAFGDMTLTHVAKGFIIHCPDLGNASDSLRFLWRDKMRQIIVGVGERNRAQIHFNKTCDFDEAIEQYAADTQSAHTDEACMNFRDAHVAVYSRLNKERALQRKIARFYLCKQIGQRPPAGLSTRAALDFNERLLDEYATEFAHFGNNLNNICSGAGAKARPMSDTDHFAHINEYFNPSFLDRRMDLKKLFNPARSILGQAWRNGLVGGEQHRPPFGIYNDTYYFNFLILRRLPEFADTGDIEHITGELFNDYSVIVNLYPENKENIKNRYQTEINRLSKSLSNPKNQSQAEADQLGILRERLKQLNHGFHTPISFDFCVQIRDQDLGALAGKTAALQTAIHALNGADYYTPNLYAACEKIYFQGFPGFPWNNYTAHKREQNDEEIVRILPLTSSFTGHLDGAQALFPGDNNQLVGVKAFIGKMPQPFLIVGAPGSGKTHMTINLLNQLYCHLGFLFIIEEKKDYGQFTKSHNCETTVIDPNGTKTFNLFYTHGTPLDDNHVAEAAALCAIFAGATDSAREDNIQRAMFSTYIRRLYAHSFEMWKRRHADCHLPLMRRAFLIHKLWQDYKVDDDECDFTQAWARVRDWEKADAAQVAAEENLVSDSDAIAFSKNRHTARFVSNLAFSCYDPARYPQLKHLVIDMGMAPDSEHDARVVNQLVTLLRAWTAAEGNNGCLFDGVGNIDLRKRIVHFECGKLGEANQQMRDAALFLIVQQVRRRIISLPRDLPKGAVFEEASQVLKAEKGADLLKEFLAKMRGYKLWAGATITTETEWFRLSSSPKDIITFGEGCEGLAVFGQTGSAKTSSMRTAIRRLLRLGLGGVVFTVKDDSEPDKKDGEFETWKKFCKDEGRLDDVVELRPGTHSFNFITAEAKGDGSGENALIENIIAIMLEAAKVIDGQHKTDIWDKAAKGLLRSLLTLITVARPEIDISELYNCISGMPKGVDKASVDAFTKNSPIVTLLNDVDKIPTNQQHPDLDTSLRYIFDEWPNIDQKTTSSVVFTLTALCDTLRRSPLRDWLCGKTTVSPADCRKGKIILINYPHFEIRRVRAVGANHYQIILPAHLAACWR
jgi:hypothetical protein